MSAHKTPPLPAIVEELAASLGRRDEGPNIALAERVARSLDVDAVSALIQVLREGNTALKADAMKVLYEAGERAPELLVPYLNVFIDLLGGRNNRLVWGSMCAIDAIAGVAPGSVYAKLSPIMAAVDQGSVITRDNGVRILVKLGGERRFGKRVRPLLLEILRTCPVDQLPMYAELAATLAQGRYAGMMVEVLEKRVVTVSRPAKRSRIIKVLKYLAAFH